MGQHLERRGIHIGEEIGGVELGHQHQRRRQRSQRPRPAAQQSPPAGPGQHQRIEPVDGVIGPGQGGRGAEDTQSCPGRFAAGAAHQHRRAGDGQHQGVVQRLLHGGKDIAHRGVQAGQHHAEGRLLPGFEPGRPGKDQPARRHEKQIAPEKGVLPPEEKAGDGVQPEDGRAPGRKGADVGVGFVEAEVPPGCSVFHHRRQLLAVDHLVAPGAGGQVDIGDRHLVDQPLVEQQKGQRGSQGGRRAQPEGLTAHRMQGPAG